MMRSPYTIMETSRGCPHSCIFCNAFISNGSTVRYRSVENVIEEMDRVNALGIKGVYFNDESFTADRVRTMALMRAIIKQNYRLSWSCNSRPDAVDYEMLQLMKRAGCSCILFGVESGNQQLLDYYQKKIRLGDISRTLEMAKKLGIETAAHFICGAPEESDLTIRSTIEFAKRMNPDYVSFNILTAYPGTKLFSSLEKQGLIRAMDWSLSNQTCTANLSTRHLTASDLEAAVRRAYRQFYYRPSYIVKKMARVRSIRDLQRLWRGFLALNALMGDRQNET